MQVAKLVANLHILNSFKVWQGDSDRLGVENTHGKFFLQTHGCSTETGKPPCKTDRSAVRNKPFGLAKRPVLQAQTAIDAMLWKPRSCTM